MTDFLAGYRGLASALRAPVVLSGNGLPALLRTFEVSSPTPASERSVDLALHATLRSLALLARLPRSPWRNTCLYRSVASCLVLRWYGIAAHIEIGVERDNEILAHAWVVRDHTSEVSSLDAARGRHMQSLRFSSARW